MKKLILIVTLCASTQGLYAAGKAQSLREQLIHKGKQAEPNSIDCSPIMSAEIPKVAPGKRAALAKDILKFLHRHQRHGGFCRKIDFKIAEEFFCNNYCSSAAGKACTPSCVNVCLNAAKTNNDINHCCTEGAGRKTLGQKILRKTKNVVAKTLSVFA